MCMFLNMNSFFTLVALLCLAAQSAANAADSPTQVWVNPGIYSLHFDRGADYREDNVGLGAEVVFAGGNHAIFGGSFINSDRQRTRYGLYEWRPLHWEPASVKVSLGLAAGAFDGYPKYRDGGWFVAALPVLSVEGSRFGVNLAIIPDIPDRLNGALAIQFKLRVW